MIIDEFQDMKFYIYNMSQELFADMDSKGRLNGPGAINLPATFDRQAQSRKAPMLVSGSAVTLIFRTVMGGPLGGRFDFIYIKPLSIPDGATLLLNTLKYYAHDKATTPELALYASAQATLCTQVAENLYNSLILKELLDLTSNFKIIKNQILKPFCA